MTETPFDISLIVCTRNRAAALSGLLDSIVSAASRAAGLRLQIILVDNGSTDDTLAVLKPWAQSQSFTALLIEEPRPGLSIARNAGLKRAEGNVIAMTDDDCELAEDFFPSLARAFAERPSPAIVGGLVALGDPQDLPMTLRLGAAATELGSQFPGGFIIGANMSFTRDVPALIGVFDERLGAGTPLKSGEDTDWLLRARHHRIPVWFDPSAKVSHFHGRRTTEDARALMAGYYFGNGAIYGKYFWRDRRVMRWLAGDVRRALHDLLRKRHSALLEIDRPSIFEFKSKMRGLRAFLAARATGQ